MAKTTCLLLLHDMSLTGAPRVVLDVFSALTDAVSPTILCPRPGPLETRARSLGPVLWAPDPALQGIRGRTAQVERLARLSPALVGLFRSPPDLVYVNSVAALSLALRLPLPDVPMLLHVHELEVAVQLLGADRPERMRRADRFIAVSRPVESMLVERYGIESERVALVHECVPDELVRRSTQKARSRDGRFVVGGVGHPQWRKGVESWLRMARALLDDVGPERVRFVWVGGRADEDDVMFRAMIDKLGLTGAIEIEPVVADPMRFYETFDVLAMTSWEDPCPLVVLESMAHGVPVVCFEGGGGAPEVVGEPELVVPGFSPGAMASTIRSLMQRPAAREELGGRLRERVRKELTVSVQAPKILAEIHRTLGARRGPTGGAPSRRER